MRVSYTNTFWHIWLFNAIHQLRSYTVHLVYVLMAAGCAFVSAAKTDCGSIGCKVFVGVVMFFFLYCLMWGAQLLFNALYLYLRPDVTVFCERQVELRDDGLHEETTHNKSLFLWSGIIKVVLMPALVCIYVTPSMALIIPNSAFPVGARDSFLRALSERASYSGSK